MEEILNKLRKSGHLMGRYKSNPDVCLGKGVNNTIVFSVIGMDCKGVLEIDGKYISVVRGNCFKIEYDGAEIFLSPSSNDRGEFTAGITGVSMVSQEWAESVVKMLMG